MLKKLPIFISLFALCNCAAPAYTTKHGIEVFDKTVENTPTRQDVEQVTDYVIARLGNKHIEGTKLLLVNVWLHMPVYKSDRVKIADGYTDIWEKEIIASVFQSCFADSGFAHELAHVVHDYNAQVPDWWHDDKRFWDMIKVMEKQMIIDLCPNDYQPRKVPVDYAPKR